MTEDWIRGISIDPLEYAKNMVVPRKWLRQKESGEYESHSLRTPVKIMALMLTIIFGRDDGTIYKLNWVLLIYYKAFEGTTFNWVDIISDNLSSYVEIAQGGLT